MTPLTAILAMTSISFLHASLRHLTDVAHLILPVDTPYEVGIIIILILHTVNLRPRGVE